MRARMQAETLKIVQRQAVKDFLATQGYEPLAYDTERFATRIRTELAKWNRVVRERNIRLQ